MNTPRARATTLSSGKLWHALVVLFCTVSLSMGITAGYALLLTLLATLLVGVIVATRHPLVTVVALLFTGVLPTVFQQTPVYSENYGAIGGGLYAVDVVLLCMAGAVLLHFFGSNVFPDSSIQSKVGPAIWRPTNAQVEDSGGNARVLFDSQRDIGKLEIAVVGPKPFRVSGSAIMVLLFCLWLFFEIARNWGLYGLSAPGEFRFRYLILVLPLYIALFFRSEKKRKHLYRLVVLSTLVLTLVCIPLIGMLKGWAVGPENRFVAADISLGLVYGLIAIALARKYHYFKVNRFTLWGVAVLVLLLVLIDSYRSVWLAAGVVLVVLVWLGEIRLRRLSSRAIVPLLLLLGIVWAAASGLGLNVGQYFVTRASELINPGGERDTTVGWRITRWEEQLPSFFASPILGEGFGRYWGDSGVFPHNLYVQTLVKTGLIGTLLYAAIVAKTFFHLRKWIRIHEPDHHAETPIVLTGLLILIAAHGYYVAYAFEYYTWMFVGLAVAVVRAETTHETQKPLRHHSDSQSYPFHA